MMLLNAREKRTQLPTLSIFSEDQGPSKDTIFRILHKLLEAYESFCEDKKNKNTFDAP